MSKENEFGMVEVNALSDDCLPCGGGACGANDSCLSNTYLLPGLLENFPCDIGFLHYLPFHQIPGKSVTITRTERLQLAKVVPECEPVPECKNPVTRPLSVFPLVEIACSFKTPHSAMDIDGGTNDVQAVRTFLAKKGCVYEYACLFSKKANPPDAFRGLGDLVAPQNVIDLKGKPLTLEVLDEAMCLLSSNNRFDIKIITTCGGLRAIRSAYYHRGIEPQSVKLSVPIGISGYEGTGGYYNPATGTGAMTRLGPTETMMQDFTSFNGAPVLINDLQDVDCDGENTCGECGRRQLTDIWFSILGARGLHGIIPDWLPNPFVVRSTMSTEISATFTQVTWPVGLALATQGALAVIKNVPCDVVCGNGCGRCDG